MPIPNQLGAELMRMTNDFKEIKNSNNLIAKNTLVLYLRMIVVMLVTLYTNRLVLSTLGVEDYGIFQVVGGLVGMFTILSGSLSVSTSRFLTFSLGKGDFAELKKTFATVRSIHIILALSMFLICELLAIWFLKTKLTIPPDRLFAAKCALHCSIASFSISLLTVPFGATVVSHEKMTAFAYMSIMDVVFNLLIVYLLMILPMDHLICYASLCLCSGILYQIISISYCLMKFPECRTKPSLDHSIVRQILSFIVWTFWGNAAVVVKDQGVVVLLNIFCGPVVNAAQGVGTQVSGVVTRFIGGFLTATRPQITKSYSSGDIDRLNYLLIKSTKFSFFLMVVLIFPIINNTKVLLDVWLVEVPAHAVNFANIILIYTFIDCFTTPLYTAVIATGQIKSYEIWLTVLYFTNIVCTYIALKVGMAPETAFVLAVFFKLLVLLLLIQQSYKLFKFDLGAYAKLYLVKMLPVIVYGIMISLLYQSFFKNDSFLKLVLFSVVFEAMMIPLIWWYGFNAGERAFVLNAIKGRFRR
jgi:O-antigen/teichoic acid export membrane protein